MSDQFSHIELTTQNDYVFFAHLLGERLRNPNFTPARREIFMKSLLQQIKPVCSLKCYQKIEKSLNEISQQKNADEKEAKEKQKKQTNKKDKKLVNVKEGIYDKHGQLIEDGYSDEDDYEDEEEPM